MGLPALQVLVQGQPHASLKDRSAAKKRAQAAVASQVHAKRLVQTLHACIKAFGFGEFVRPGPGTADAPCVCSTLIRVWHTSQNGPCAQAKSANQTLVICLAHYQTHCLTRCWTQCRTVEGVWFDQAVLVTLQYSPVAGLQLQDYFASCPLPAPERILTSLPLASADCNLFCL